MDNGCLVQHRNAVSQQYGTQSDLICILLTLLAHLNLGLRADSSLQLMTAQNSTVQSHQRFWFAACLWPERCTNCILYCIALWYSSSTFTIHNICAFLQMVLLFHRHVKPLLLAPPAQGAMLSKNIGGHVFSQLSILICLDQLQRSVDVQPTCT